MWNATEELLHVEVVKHACFPALTGCWVEKLPVGVEEGSEAADERCTNLVGVEGGWADDTDAVETSEVHYDAAA